MRNLTTLAGLIVISFSQLCSANTLILPSPNEPDLTGSGGILDNVFGLANLQRIDDDLDQYWSITGTDVGVTAVAKHAGYSQSFGFIDNNDNFTLLLYVPFMNGQSNTFNVACRRHRCSKEDHMVSWLITGGQFAGDYVIAWEDLKHLGDRDYNDLVVHVSDVMVVPVPAAIWLFGSGLTGLAVAARRRRV